MTDSMGMTGLESRALVGYLYDQIAFQEVVSFSLSNVAGVGGSK